MKTMLGQSPGIKSTGTIASTSKRADFAHITVRIRPPRRGHMDGTNCEEVRDGVGSTCGITPVANVTRRWSPCRCRLNAVSWCNIVNVHRARGGGVDI